MEHRAQLLCNPHLEGLRSMGYYIEVSTKSGKGKITYIIALGGIPHDAATFIEKYPDKDTLPSDAITILGVENQMFDALLLLNMEKRSFRYLVHGDSRPKIVVTLDLKNERTIKFLQSQSSVVKEHFNIWLECRA